MTRNSLFLHRFRYLAILIVGGILLTGFLVWQSQQKMASSSLEIESEEIQAGVAAEAESVPSFEETSEESYTFTAQSPMTAEELLNEQAEVEYQDFGSAGKFVKSLYGLASTPEYFWSFYVNGEFAEAGVSQTVLEPGDTIEFRYEKVEPLQ